MTDYDETDIEPMILRLYERVKPFYQQLHAYVRRRLTEVYRNHGLDPHGPIPAHLLGTGFRNTRCHIKLEKSSPLLLER